MEPDQEIRPERVLNYVKAAQKALNEFPDEVKTDFLTELDLFRQYEPTNDTCRMKGKLRDVYEIKESDESGTYRVMFTAIVEEQVWVLHAFQKKSPSGIATPQKDLDLIYKRLQEVKTADAARRK